MKIKNKIKELKGKQLEKKEKIIITIALFCFFLFLLVIGICYIQNSRIQQKFGSKLKVNNQSYEGMTQKEAAKKIKDEFESCHLILEENGSQIYQITLGEAGYTLEQQKLEEKLLKLLEQQTIFSSVFGKEKNETLVYPIRTEGETLDQMITAEKIGGDRTPCTDAYMNYDEASKSYVIVPEIQGTKLNDEALQMYVKNSLKEQLTGEKIPDEIVIVLDASVYEKPNVTADQNDLVNLVGNLNQQMEVYKNTSITYLFGETKEVVTSEMICSWLIQENGQLRVNEEKVRSYVQQLAEQYNTIFVKREFKTSLGSTVLIKNNEYGYRIDQNAEVEQLLNEISSGNNIEREPIYSKKGYQRNGKDDLMGSYIELSIQNQHLWLYKNGNLVTQTDVVTGLPTKERATMEGAWPIAYKARNFQMSSATYGYNLTVDYWMPFVLGQGLHDLKNRTAFGGEIYKTNGSHGCVNLPLEQAKIIYEAIDAGYPILIY